MDTSGSVTHADFNRTKSFIKDFISSFDQSAFKTHFFLLHYDHWVYVDFKFNPNLQNQDLFDKIDAILHTQGSTVTQRALKVGLDLFKLARKDPKKVPRVFLVLTDGRTFGGRDKLKDPTKALKVVNTVLYFSVEE